MNEGYSTLGNIKNSLKLAWKYKILWVFALLLVGGGMVNNFSSMSGSSDDDEKRPAIRQDTTKTLPNRPADSYNYNYDKKQKNVKGATDTKVRFDDPKPANGMPLRDPSSYMVNPFAKALSTYMYLAIPILLSLFIGIIYITMVIFVTKSWVTGAVLHGTKQALQEQNINLLDTSNVGVNKIREILKLIILISVISLGALLLVFILPVILYVLKVKTGAFILGLLLVLIYLILLFDLYFVSIYAKRYVVLKDDNYKEALKKGYGLLKKNFGKSFKLINGNCLVQLLIALSIGGPVAFIIISLSAAMGGTNTNPPSLLAAMLLIPVGIGAMLLFTAMSGFLTTANEISWTTLFLHADPKDTEKGPITQ